MNGWAVVLNWIELTGVPKKVTTECMLTAAISHYKLMMMDKEWMNYTQK